MEVSQASGHTAILLYTAVVQPAKKKITGGNSIKTFYQTLRPSYWHTLRSKHQLSHSSRYFKINLTISAPRVEKFVRWKCFVPTHPAFGPPGRIPVPLSPSRTVVNCRASHVRVVVVDAPARTCVGTRFVRFFAFCWQFIYKVTMVVGDKVLLASRWLFNCLPNSAWAG